MINNYFSDQILDSNYLFDNQPSLYTKPSLSLNTATVMPFPFTNSVPVSVFDSPSKVVANPIQTAFVSKAATLSFTGTILDKGSKKPIAKVNILVNDVPVTQTNASGQFTLNNIEANDVVETSHQTYASYFSFASAFPRSLQLEYELNPLKEVVVTNSYKKPTQPTNWALWIALGLGAAVAYKSFSGKKAVKATI